jgi:hypothetical protein
VHAPLTKEKLKAGEEISLDLHANEVLLLHKQIANLCDVAKGGIPRGQRTVRVIDASTSTAVFAGSEAQLLTQMVARYPPSLDRAIPLALFWTPWAPTVFLDLREFSPRSVFTLLPDFGVAH